MIEHDENPLDFGCFFWVADFQTNPSARRLEIWWNLRHPVTEQWRWAISDSVRREEVFLTSRAESFESFYVILNGSRPQGLGLWLWRRALPQAWKFLEHLDLLRCYRMTFSWLRKCLFPQTVQDLSHFTSGWSLLDPVGTRQFLRSAEAWATNGNPKALRWNVF